MGGNFLLWLGWAAFGSALVTILWRFYRPAVLNAPAEEHAPVVIAAPAAWLFCEDGTALDRRVQWFELRTGGETVVGGRPRSDTPDTHFVYLTAEDIVEDHALVAFDPEAARYQVTTLDAGTVLHNNDPLPTGETAQLADGDTLDLGRLSRFRFTLTGPETS